MVRFVLTFLIATLACAEESVAPAPLAPVIVEDERPVGSPAHQSGEFSGRHVAVDRFGESSLSRILGRRTAIFAQKTGGDESVTGFQMRGQDAAQSRYFLESIPLTDAQHHAAQVGWFSVEALQGLDIYPEGTPSILGGDGLGGAVVLRLPPPGFGASAIGGRVGSFASRRLFARAAVRNPLPLSLLADFQASREDFIYRDVAGTPLIPYDDSWRRRDHNGFRSLAILPQLRLWRQGANHLDWIGFHTLRRNEVPGPVGMPQKGLLDQRYHLGALDAHGVASQGWEWRATAYAWSHAQQFQAPPELEALLLTGSQTDAAGVRLVASRNATESSSWEASLGVQRDQSTVSNRVSETRGVRWGMPIGITSRQSIGRNWVLKPAASLQSYFYSGGIEKQTAIFSPRLGLDYLYRGGRLRALVGRYERAPSLMELFGAPSTVAANPQLANERSVKFEAGWDGRWSPRGALLREAQASMTFSAAFNNDLIVLVPNSQWSYVGQNIGKSHILAQEVAAEAGLARSWSVRTSGILLWTRNLSNAAAYFEKRLPMRPDYRAGFEVEWAHGNWKLAYALQGTGPLFIDAANAKRIAAFWEHGLWGSWNSPVGAWTLELRNLTDALTVSSSDWNFNLVQNTTGLAGFPSPGRRVYLTWRYEI